MEFCAFELLADEELELACREGPGEAEGLVAFGVDALDEGFVGGMRSFIMSNILASSNDSMRWPGSSPCRAKI